MIEELVFTSSAKRQPNAHFYKADRDKTVKAVNSYYLLVMREAKRGISKEINDANDRLRRTHKINEESELITTEMVWLPLVPLLIFVVVVDHFTREINPAMSSINDDLFGKEGATTQNRFMSNEKNSPCISDY